jgi:hypothetical protein
LLPLSLQVIWLWKGMAGDTEVVNIMLLSKEIFSYQ